MRYYVLAALGMVIATSHPAAAHIALQSPTGRFVSNSLKTAPCGAGNRSGVVTPLVAGQMLTVRWKETVSHSGHFRIALSERDSDFDEPTSLAIPTTLPAWDLADGIPDKTGTQVYTHTVRIPTTPCSACVLQLLQIMGAGTDGTNNGPFSGVYHECADVSIGPAEDAGVSTDSAIPVDLSPDRPDARKDPSGRDAMGMGGAPGTGGAAGSGGRMATDVCWNCSSRSCR